MKTIIDHINKMEPTGNKREFFGQVYDGSGKLLHANELISTITAANGGWHWQVHLPELKNKGENQGSCLTYQEACAQMQAFLEQN